MEKRIKKSFATANVTSFSVNEHMVDFYTPKAGDVGVFRLLSTNSNYMLDVNGSSISIFEGDLLMASFGNRYATNQYEAYVPSEPTRRCQLIGRGGVAGIVASANPTFKSAAAELELVGYATDGDNKVINTIQWNKLERFDADAPVRSKVILSIGSSMDSGKTTTAANMCAGLTNQGYRVGFIKLTGTAFPKDAQLVYDRGAALAMDFTHYGFPSTFLESKETILDIYQSLVSVMEQRLRPDYIVMEIADGILQRETDALLRDRDFMQTIHGVVLSCGDSLGVISAIEILNEINIQPFALSGLFTASELLIREIAPFVSLPVLRAKQLINGAKLIEALADNQLHFADEFAYTMAA